MSCHFTLTFITRVREMLIKRALVVINSML